MSWYLGKIVDKDAFVEFEPLYAWQNGKFEEIDKNDELIRKSGNGRILFVKGKKARDIKEYSVYKDGMLWAFELEKDDVKDNLSENGEPKQTGLKLDVSKLPSDKIRRPHNFEYYYCVEAENFNFSTNDTNADSLREITDDYVSPGMQVVIRIKVKDDSVKDDPDFLIGPVDVTECPGTSLDGKRLISIKGSIEKRYIEGLQYPDYSKRIVRLADLPYIVKDEAYCEDGYKDYITDKELLEGFCSYIKGEGVCGKVDLDDVDGILEKYKKDFFKDIPVDIREQRLKKLTDMLTCGKEYVAVADTVSYSSTRSREDEAKPDVSAVPVPKIDEAQIEEAEGILDKLKKQIEQKKQEREELEDALDKLKGDLKAFFDNSIENARQLAMDEKVLSLLQQAVLGDVGEEKVYKSVAKELQDIDKKTDLLKDHLVTEIQKHRAYGENDILNILICISQGLLTVFSGEPGAGKTSICKIIASAMGLNTLSEKIEASDGVFRGRFVNVSVKKGWTTERDLVGYYNPLTKTFDSSNRKLFDGLSILNKEANGAPSDLPYIVLLDEANLSPMEYYWADYMNICDDLDENSEINLGDKYCFKVPGNLRFLATINNDHTTEALSPRLIDRAWVITLPEIDGGAMKALEDGETISWKAFSDAFGVKDETKISEEEKKALKEGKPISWDAFLKEFGVKAETEISEAFGVKAETEISEEAKKVYNAYNGVLEKAKAARIAVSHRVEDAIKRYWWAAKDVLKPEEERTAEIIALDYAIAQRILPHIDCVGKDAGEKLEDLLGVLEGNKLNKSAEILNNILEKGKSDEMMPFYQFFA